MQILQMEQDTAAGWTSRNPVLGNGLGGYETDTGLYKIGDGIKTWNTLGYSSSTTNSDGALTQAALDNHINAAEPHPVYDDGPSLVLLYQNAKV